jgi:trehalose 6-phosphate synthase
MRSDVRSRLDPPAESSDCRPASQPGDSQNLEQHRRQAKLLDDAKKYQLEVALKQEENNQNGYALDNKIKLQEEVQKIREMKRSLYIVSNRGPVEYQITEDQKFEIKSGAGGLANAMNSIIEYKVPVAKWFSSPMSEGDRKAMQLGQNGDYHFVALEDKVYDAFYNKISNEFLWFILHEMYKPGQHNVSEVGCEGSSASLPSRYKKPSEIKPEWRSYTQANQTFAKMVHAEIKKNARKKPIVVIHDYHFLQLPDMLRKLHRTIILQQFMHVPWPKPKVWKALPRSIVEDIYRGMAGNNIVGFQTNEDAQNFLQGTENYLPGAKIDFENRMVRWHKHNTQVRSYPISISVEKVRDAAKRGLDKKSANNEMREIKRNAQKKGIRMQGSPEKIHKILRVDRIEPTKNLLVGFRAYDMMLERFPKWRGKVVFQCRFIPSRQNVETYKELQKQIESEIDRINKKYGNKSWKPIDAFFGHDYEGALAEMVSYDVLLVNPIKDGMNLVAKEGVVVNQNDGVLILSQTAGAFHELKNGVIPLASPSNLEETTEALGKALTMSEQERKMRATSMRDVVERNDIALWLARQLRDINPIIFLNSPKL